MIQVDFDSFKSRFREYIGFRKSNCDRKDITERFTIPVDDHKVSAFEPTAMILLFLFKGYNETPTSQTVDNYMAHLRSIIQEGSPENAGLIAAARDIISRLNYSA